MPRKQLSFVCLAVLGCLLVVFGACCEFRGRSRGVVATQNQSTSEPLSSQWAGDYDLALTHDGIERIYVVHVPPGYDQMPTPLVLNLHGGFGNGKQQCEMSKMDPVSDAHNFIVACPTGTNKGVSDLYFWNDGYIGTSGVSAGVDDVDFILTMIADLKSRFNIDEGRIYATGMSNGAIMSYRLACEWSDMIAAIAPVAGSMAGYMEPSNPVYCNPAQPVPVMIFHGLPDENVPYEGGIGADAVSKYDHPGVRQAVAFWVARNGLSPQPTEEGRIGNAVHEKYGGDDDAGQVILWTLEDGGHTWPGGDMVLPERRLGNINEDISASEEMWEFFERHPSDGDG